MSVPLSVKLLNSSVSTDLCYIIVFITEHNMTGSQNIPSLVTRPPESPLCKLTSPDTCKLKDNISW